MVDPVELRKRLSALRQAAEVTLQTALELEVKDASVRQCVLLIAQLDAMREQLEQTMRDSTSRRWYH